MIEGTTALSPEQRDAVVADYEVLVRVRAYCWGKGGAGSEAWTEFVNAVWAQVDDKSPLMYYEPGLYAAAEKSMMARQQRKGK